MKKILYSLLLCLVTCLGQQARACYANFTHTNACVGDTVWVYAADLYAVQYWDFGDTTTGNPNIAYADTAYHIYTAPGTYYITHFVNIGYVWALETDEITVGTNCFDASFTSSCNGSLYMSFTNTSIGHNLSYFWDYGDPASGFNNSTDADGYHYYSLPGSYTVTLIISDGVNTDTSVQTINVDSNCLSASYTYSLNTCLGDPTAFNISYSAGVTSAVWDFGDPASGSANTSTDLYPTHTYSAPGLYIGHVTYSDGINTNTLMVYANVTDCTVWSGDCNRDAQVTPEDIFAVGLYYGMNGSARPNASTNFSSQASNNWGGDMYLQDIVDYKQADANGDGIINELDVAAIGQNFGRKHSGWRNITSDMQNVPADAPQINVALPAMSMGGNNTATLNLNAPSDMAYYVYGYAVGIPYNANQVDPSSITVNFNNSWLADGMPSTLMNWYYNDQVNHIIYIAAVRNNQTGVKGTGAVASINYKVLPSASGTLTMNIMPNAKLMSNAVNPGENFGRVQHYLKARLQGSSSTISVGVASISKLSIKISPVPADNQINITPGSNEKLTEVSLMNEIGQCVWSGKSQSVNVKSLPSGNYWLHVVTDRGDYKEHVQVMH